MIDQIRDTGLGQRHQFRWEGQLPSLVEKVAIFIWCKPFLTVGDALILVIAIVWEVGR